ncbi:hypothetical protein FRC98_20015 [Lujinxingia vulgaris]|uniref:Uncharacterized protein n=1 Tax=Lujinxingia vulgaris TaxID=2600176 RepID=A0A5C6WYR5_9DELT|nr:choice-of-anchor Q domain-containing protein [Lujinxingia vulgaris]TXD33891.1 hypothetical protein FRC98_20015 [Lujinxingia vulgaris]
MNLTRLCFILSLSASLTIGCGGDADDTDQPDTTIEENDAGSDADIEPDADTDVDPDADTDIEPDADTDLIDESGTLILTLDGLPEDAEWPDIELVGDTTLTVPESGQLTEIPAGDYELIAERVLRGLSTFETPTQSITIEADETLEATLSYELIPAAWEVIIAGLPASVDADIALEGPDFNDSLEGSTTYDALTPGAYLLTPRDVTDGGATYSAGIRTAALASGTNDPTTITYTLSPAELDVVITGLPAGQSAQVSITGPAGYANTINDSTLLNGLVPGEYTVEGAEVDLGDQIFKAAPITLTLDSNATETATLSYEVVAGELVIVAEDLPAGADVAATLIGPAPSTDEVAISETTTELAPGDYTLNFGEVQTGGARFEPTPTTLPITIASRQQSEANVSYAAAGGTAAIIYDLIGSGSITVRLGEGTIATERTLSGQGTAQIPMPEGAYTLSVISNDLGTDAFGNPYPLLGDSQGIVVVDGMTTTVELSAFEPTLVISSGDNGAEPGTLREVISRVNDGSVITFDPSITLIHPGTSFVINRELSIEGPGADQLTLSANRSDRIFTVLDSGSLHLEGLTLADTAIAGDGGAVHATGEFSAIDVDFVDNNAGGHGGAVYIDTGEPLAVLRRVRFISNASDGDGGAIYTRIPLIVEDALFESNSSEGFGGAIFAHAGSTGGNMVITRALFDGNFAGNSGGGVFSRRGAFVGNTTFSENTCFSSPGGAWMQYDGEANFVHTTFDDNFAIYGEAIASYCDNATPVYLKNSVVHGDSSQSFHCQESDRPVASLGYNYIQVDSPHFQAQSSTDEVGTEATPLPVRLSPLADNGGFTSTMAVAPGVTNDVWMRLPASACVDDAGLAITDDQRGEPRPNAGYCSIGAWENTAR